MIVRIANLTDIKWILEELKKFYEFYGSKKLVDFDNENYNQGLIANLVNNHLFLISESNEVRTGFICGVITPHYFNPAMSTLSELFWWVTPEHRSSRAGAMLLSEYTLRGKDFDWVTMTIEDKSPVKPESLIKRGWKHKETVFLMENY